MVEPLADDFFFCVLGTSGPTEGDRVASDASWSDGGGACARGCKSSSSEVTSMSDSVVDVLDSTGDDGGDNDELVTDDKGASV